MLSVLVLFLILAKVRAGLEDGDYEKDNYVPYPWKPVPGPYGDRLKPIKAKDPKPDDNKYYYGAYSRPYYPSSYIQGLYTYPYFGYGDIPPWYQPSYPTGSYGGYYIKKDNKEKYSPVYKN